MPHFKSITDFETQPGGTTEAERALIAASRKPVTHRPLRRPVLCVAWLFLVALPLAAPAQTQPETRPETRPEPLIRIEPTPRLPCTKGQPACQINRALFALDQAHIAAAADCALRAPQDLSPHQDPETDPLQSWYAADIDTPLTGPHFYTVLAWVYTSCTGAAHGDSYREPHVFDLASGAEIDPLTLLPAALRPTSDAILTTQARDRIKPLTDLYLDLADKGTVAECGKTLTDDPHSFTLWPDAAEHALILQPTGLAYVDRPCETSIAIPVSLLATLGADPDLIADLSAHL